MGKADNEHTQKRVEEESDRYGDIVIGDFPDNYENLTIKGIFGLKWLSMYCKNVKYAIKADDDAFLNIFKMLNLMNRYEDHKRVVMCGLWTVMPILRDSNKCMKWCVRYSEFPGRQLFPKYCAGVTYTLSREIVDDMYSYASKTPFFWIDDVYITGLLLGKTKNVEYINLLRNITLREKRALDQYLNSSIPEQSLFYFSHVRKPANMGILFRAAIERQDSSMLAQLNHTIVSSVLGTHSRLVKSLTPPKQRSSAGVWKIRRLKV